MNYQKITTNDTANGDGIRVTLWVSGCSHHCEGCHNPQTWDYKLGEEFTYDTFLAICEELEKPWVAGLTLSGGDPFHNENRQHIADLVMDIKKRFNNKDIWCYTGYTIEELWKLQDYDINVGIILVNIDILVDGKYMAKYKDVSYPWAGSSNQRIWANVDGQWIQSEYEKTYREAKENKYEII